MEGTSICVLSMNRPGTLTQTISDIKHYAIHPYEIIIVDNGSTDPVMFPILDNYSNDLDIRVIRNKENVGLSVGTNQGLEAGKYDTLIHMDDDCLVRYRGWNQVMRDYLSRPEIGMVVPGTYGEVIRHDGYNELRWALGMCWAIRKDLFEEIGGYDPQLMHQNECDMAIRVRMSGYVLSDIPSISAVHNDPGGEASELSLARAHLGVVQFRDKWTSFFRGKGWTYASQPLYLMQHWPPDQDFYRRYAIQAGVNLNPLFGEELTETDLHQLWRQIDFLGADQKVNVNGTEFFIYRELRTDCYHGVDNFEGYEYDRQLAIDNWLRLTGESYSGYRWPANILKPY